LYTEAAVATKTTVQPQTGFRFMALALTDGRSVGFSNPKKMQLAAWSPAPEPSPSARPAGPQPAARGPGAASAGSQPSQPGPTGAVPAAANARQMPAANVNLSPAANAPYVRRPAFGYPTR
jgi:hypothetical protein